ncbi:MaoC like domain-containing protein [Tistlia consotensis]|uniref:MaoC like domain-containing protein n=1 Tax=Tistlia consotensis USBA 355 TaxID=560819 RepID=A0A1Y6B4T7_9PROT|nr:MaoC/PaaZ C-terminal domain-containing protein [Tistlia consotensis]SME92124.1 MaoC like domain-containing protein [Tistlia consotensis USBA 355]SNR27840.1 MaoC like domain-containing protein [Tistlia consotensis]
MTGGMTGLPLRVSRVFTQADFDRFAELSGDDNPIHVDPAFSAETRFGRTVAHGMLLYAALWGLIRGVFPDAIQESQDLMFPAPTYADEPVFLEVDLLERPEPDRLVLAVRVLSGRAGAPTLEGRTRIRLAGGATP